MQGLMFNCDGVGASQPHDGESASDGRVADVEAHDGRAVAAVIGPRAGDPQDRSGRAVGQQAAAVEPVVEPAEDGQQAAGAAENGQQPAVESENGQSEAAAAAIGKLSSALSLIRI